MSEEEPKRVGKCSSRSSATKKASQALQKGVESLIRSASSRQLFEKFGMLTSADKIKIKITDFADVQRAIFNQSLKGHFDPIRFQILDKKTDYLLYHANLEAGVGVVIYDHLDSSKQKLLVFALPNRHFGPQSPSLRKNEEVVGKLQVPPEHTLYKIHEVLDCDSDQYSVYSVFQPQTFNMQIVQKNPCCFPLQRCLCDLYGKKCYKVIENGRKVGKIRPGNTETSTAFDIEFMPRVGEESRAVILGATLYLTLLVFPELYRLLEESVNEQRQ